MSTADDRPAATEVAAPQCSNCGEMIADPAEAWPYIGDEVHCQTCWEAESARWWREMIALYPAMGQEPAHA